MKIGRTLATLTALLLSACATQSDDKAPARPVNERLAPLTSDHLERFHGDWDFYAYLNGVRRIARSQGAWWALDQEAYDAIPVPAPPPPPPPPPAAVAGAPEPSAQSPSGDVVVTATGRAADGAESITNVQTRGVDEGDIIKQIGHFLIVLQDGRLFTVDLSPATGRMAFVDRMNVYRNASVESWYDEMLVYQHRIVVTGYSYVRRASEISVFALSDEGHLTREAVYYMSSNDYYDPENYASRLVGDSLVVYSPMALTQRFPNNRVTWPLIRRWVSGDGENMVLSRGTPLFDAKDIYRPVQPTLSPVIHSITTCPLGAPGRGDELECTATAFIGPQQREFYIAPDAAYLWLSGDTSGGDYTNEAVCNPETARAHANSSHSAVFRMPLDNSAPGVIGVRGSPRNQFGLASTSSEFRALLVWNSAWCNQHSHLTLKYFSTPVSAFSNHFADAAADRFADVPNLDASTFENRFTDAYVVYGSRDNWSSRPPGDDEPPRAPAQLVAVPLANPAGAVTLTAPHNVIRAERLGPSNIIITGYKDNSGLSLSVLDLTSGAPRFSTATTLTGRYESEGRSHAFNSRMQDDSNGLLGIPTVHYERRAGRFVWNSAPSDVSFLSLDPSGLHGLGELTVNPHGVDPSYRCEVSCVDWYGNSRPIFTGGRIFALSGTELVEGRIENGRIVDAGRVNLSVRPPSAK